MPRPQRCLVNPRAIFQEGAQEEFGVEAGLWRRLQLDETCEHFPRLSKCEPEILLSGLDEVTDLPHELLSSGLVVTIGYDSYL